MKPLLLIGETCTDKTTWCSHTRQSPEDASIPVWKIEKETISNGMVSIVAKQLDGLEVPYTLLTNISNEIVKNRVFLNNKQVARIDEDTKVNMELFSYEWLKANINKFSSIAVSDYGKGFCSKEVIDLLNNSNKTVYLDPHPHNPIWQYKNIAMVKLNVHEALYFTDTNNEALAAQKLINELGCKNVFITLGKEGIYWYNGVQSSYLPSKAIDPVNCSGAGDIVFSSLVASLERGIEPIEAASLAMERVGKVLNENSIQRT